jgi:hypothetical protein
MDWPALLRPLPRFVAPVPDETITSYLRRLADANRLDPAALRALLAQATGKDAPVPLGRLAEITGLARQSLAHAMPQLAEPDELAGLHLGARPRARPRGAFVACRRCTARRAGRRPVIRWALHDDVVCLRHRRWISEHESQPDLSGQPEVLAAHIRHRRMIRRHGRHAVMTAFDDAQHVCLGWYLAERYSDGFERRMAAFHGPGWRDAEDIAWDDDTFDAALYPQTVALARLFVIPFWRDRIIDDDWPDQGEFIAELRRTVAPDYAWNAVLRIGRREIYDPLIEWRLRTRRMRLQPPPPEHPANQPETIGTSGAARPDETVRKSQLEPGSWDSPEAQTVPAT